LSKNEYRTEAEAAPSAVANVVLPVAFLLVVVAVLAGLVFGGVVQGHAARVAPAQTSTSGSTIVIGQ
jgi:hypothetical protein